MDPSEEPTIQYTLSSRCEDFLNDTQAAVRANARPEDIPLTASIATRIGQTPSGVLMSTAFNTASDYGDGCWDIILVSSDIVHFYVRICRLLNASTSYFGSLLLPFFSEDNRIMHACINISEGMYVLDVLLHVIYDIPFQYAPGLHVLLDAIRALHKYGIPLDLYIVPGKPFFEEIARQTHHDPLEVYAVAAEHNIFPLARKASGHLLKLPLVFLADGMAARLGLAYLHMLHSLHLARVYHLQRILAKPPRFHEPTTLCGESEYQVLQLAWYNETINFTSQANPDVSGIEIWNALDRVRSLLTCAECQHIVQRRIDEAISQWSETPTTISRDMREFYVALSSSQ